MSGLGQTRRHERDQTRQRFNDKTQRNLVTPPSGGKIDRIHFRQEDGVLPADGEKWPPLYIGRGAFRIRKVNVFCKESEDTFDFKINVDGTDKGSAITQADFSDIVSPGSQVAKRVDSLIIVPRNSHLSLNFTSSDAEEFECILTGNWI